MSAGTVRLAKVSKPTIVGALPRERLFQLLDEGEKRPVTWISGPAGAGKTTLVAGWLEFQGFPCVWYQADAGDRDLATFFYYMGLACKNIAPRTRKSMPLLTPEYLMDIPAFTRGYFNELYRRVQKVYGPKGVGSRKKKIAGNPNIAGPKRICIVIDNYQDIPPGSPLHEILNIGFSLLPEGITAVIISRNDPCAEYARLRASRKISYIGWDDIRFTIKETGKMLRLSGFGSLRSDTIRRLYDTTDGWIAGIVLLTEKMKADAITDSQLKKMPRESIFDYFAMEVFGKADKDVQKLLLETAFLPQVTSGMAERLTSVRRAGEILQAMDRSHFFITSHAGQERTYQYHPLFKEFLQARARNLLGMDEVCNIRSRAGLILRDSKLFEAAAVLLTDSGNWEALCELILSQAPFLISNGRNTALQEWILSLPERMLDANPWLSYWLGVCRMPFDPQQSRSDFEESFRKFNDCGDRSGALLSWSGAVETFFLERGDFSRMDPWIQWLDTTMGAAPSFTSREIEVAVVFGVIGAITFRVPGYRRKSVWLKRAEALVESDIPLANRIRIASILYIYYIYMGNHRAFSHMMAVLGPSMAGSSLPPLTKIQWHLMEAIHSHMVTASAADCFSAVGKGLDLSRKTGMRVFDPLLLTIGSYGALMAEKPNEMDKTLSELRTLIAGLGYFDNGNFSCCLLNRDLCGEDIPAALEHGRQMVEAFEKPKAPLPLVLAHAGYGQALFEAGRFREAAAQFSYARRYTAGIGDFDWEVILFFPEAYMAFKTGKPSKGLNLLRRAMKLAAGQKYLNMLYWRPAMMSFLCLKALEEGIEVEYVKNLICVRNLPPPVRAPVSEAWPFPVKIFTFGRFSIVIEEQPTILRGKLRQKPLALLKAVIASGVEGVSRDHLMQLLWPEAEGDKAYQSLRFTVHQLRKLIGIPEAIRTEDERIMLDGSRVWVDSWALQEILNHGVAMTKDSGRTKVSSEALEEFTAKAVSLHRGDFLPGDSRYSWVLPERERLKGKLLRLISLSGERLEKTKRWEKAIEYYQKALELNELQEEFHRRLMRCHLGLGRRAEAMIVYNRCKALLKEALDIQPSRETETLLAQVMSSAEPEP